MGTTDLDRSCDKMRRRGSEERQPSRRYVRASHASHTSRLTKHAREVTIGVDVVLLTNNFVVANGVGHRQHGDRASVNQAANPRVAAVLVGFQQEFSLPARGQVSTRATPGSRRHPHHIYQRHGANVFVAVQVAAVEHLRSALVWQRRFVGDADEPLEAWSVAALACSQPAAVSGHTDVCQQRC